MAPIKYVVAVSGQERMISKHHSTHIPCHLLNFDAKNDQEMKSYLCSLARDYGGEIMAEGPFRCVICESQARVGTNHPIICQNVIIDTFFPVCDRGPCKVRAAQLKVDKVHQALQHNALGLDTS